ncbi:MAG: serine hydrolase domain-containing protein [Caulobacterales bacterium]
MAAAFGAADAARVSAAAREAVDELKVSGVAIGVVSGEILAYSEGFGFADIESGRPQDPALRQRIGSITKTMVGLCAMALVDEGRRTLADRLIDHIPELTIHGDGASVTVRHLLTHTAGIGEVAMPEDVKDTQATLWSEQPDADVLGLFPKGLTIDVPPGTKWSYANLGFALLGEIVERVEGEPIAEVVRRRVFEPLGMTNSDLLDLPHPDLTTGYHRAPGEDARAFAARTGEEIVEEPTVDGVNIRGKYLYIRGGGAAGAVQSTVPDMARYAAALLRNGGGIVRPQTFEAMTGPQWQPDTRLESWGLSFQRFERFGRRMFGHGGGVIGGWNSMLLISPDDDLAVIVHANCAFEDLGKLLGRVLAAALDAAPPKLAGEVAPQILAAAPGVYEAIPGQLTNFRIIGGMGRLQIKAENGGLTLYARRGPWKGGVRMYPADAADPGFFRLADDAFEPSALALIRDAEGQVTGLRCDRLVEMVRTDQVQPWV